MADNRPSSYQTDEEEAAYGDEEEEDEDEADEADEAVSGSLPILVRRSCRPAGCAVSAPSSAANSRAANSPSVLCGQKIITTQTHVRSKIGG